MLHKIKESYTWAGARKQGKFLELNVDQLLSEQIDYKDGSENLIEKRTEADLDNPKLRIYEHDLYGMEHSKPKVKNKLQMMETKFSEPLKVKVKPKTEDIIMYHHEGVSDTQTGVIFAEQDHNFKRSGEKITQFTSMVHPAENVETLDHKFRHAADYSSTSWS